MWRAKCDDEQVSLVSIKIKSPTVGLEHLDLTATQVGICWIGSRVWYQSPGFTFLSTKECQSLISTELLYSVIGVKILVATCAHKGSQSPGSQTLTPMVSVV